ncbi:hypothetical protein TcYC6_0011330 [Trypanosoma cruzi]|uniref:Uncharacterized protein n=1 Tax=Trypanosoma cruzi TaxID=5693 RepID=A0A7J6XX46_TRYCR|nr:hypothetical protein ECC02_008625 [Trypanosoma cruzi]KAF8275962.1 hypothetical protein TcYC6_0011330 [Trypanosoma cruzi]
MEKATFDDMVLQWVESLQGISRASSCRVLQRTCDSLALAHGTGEVKAKAKAQALLEAVQALPDPEEMRQAALFVVQARSASSVEERLSPYCRLVLRYGNDRAVKRLASAQVVAIEISAQNATVTERWTCVGHPQVWSVFNSPRVIGVRSVFAANGKDVLFSFYDEVEFDVCGRIECVARTLLVECPSNAEEVRSVLRFGDVCAS